MQNTPSSKSAFSQAGAVEKRLAIRLEVEQMSPRLQGQYQQLLTDCQKERERLETRLSDVRDNEIEVLTAEKFRDNLYRQNPALKPNHLPHGSRRREWEKAQYAATGEVLTAHQERIDNLDASHLKEQERFLDLARLKHKLNTFNTISKDDRSGRDNNGKGRS